MKSTAQNIARTRKSIEEMESMDNGEAATMLSDEALEAIEDFLDAYEPKDIRDSLENLKRIAALNIKIWGPREME